MVHDLNPRAMSPKVKGFVQAQSWVQDLTSGRHAVSRAMPARRSLRTGPPTSAIGGDHMLLYLLRRLLYTLPIAIGVSIVCFR